jgi:hypothetical protein
MSVSTMPVLARLPRRETHYAWMLLLVAVLHLAIPLVGPTGESPTMQPRAEFVSLSTVVDFLDAEWRAESDLFTGMQLTAYEAVSLLRSAPRVVITIGEEVSLPHPGNATFLKPTVVFGSPANSAQYDWTTFTDAPPDPPPDPSSPVR